MNNLKRLIWCAIVFGIQAFYFPLWPIWVVPYVLICGWWVVACAWTVRYMEERLYEAFFIASAFVSVPAMTIFTLFPTYVVRPALSAGDWPTQILSLTYSKDYAYNVFLSGHVYVTTLIALFWSRWFPKWRWLWMSTVVIIVLATLFTHRHYLPDPIGGLALAWFGYRMGLWCVADSHSNRRQVLESRML